MPGPRIQDIVFDEVNEAKFGEHGITVRQVAFVLYESDFELRKNRNRRTGQYLAIGRDSSGACLVIPLQRATGQHTWRPVTAWYCKDAEERLLG